MGFHKSVVLRLIVVGALCQLAFGSPLEKTGEYEAKREETPGRQFGGLLVEHPDFPGRPVFLGDPPEAETSGQGPTSLLSDFGIDVPALFPSFAAKPSPDADSDADVDADVDSDTEKHSTAKPIKRHDEDRNKNQYQPQYRPQNKPQSRPQYKPPRPRPQHRPHQTHYVKPEPQYSTKPESHSPYGNHAYEAFKVHFPGYGEFIVLTEPGSVGGHSSPFQLVHKPMGYVTLYPKASHGVYVKTGDVETPTTPAPPKGTPST